MKESPVRVSSPALLPIHVRLLEHRSVNLHSGRVEQHTYHSTYRHSFTFHEPNEIWNGCRYDKRGRNLGSCPCR